MVAENVSDKKCGLRGSKMAKLYFRYGAMGSSKSANVLMVRYNYEERGHRPAGWGECDPVADGIVGSGGIRG